MKNANSIFTRTNRVVIRQFDLQDIEAFYQYRANPSIATYQSWENYTYEEAESFVQHQMTQKPNQPGTWFQYAIALSESNQLLGDCAIHTLDSEPRNVEIGFTLAPEYQGMGLSFLPHHCVRNELEQGTLKQISIDPSINFNIKIEFIYKKGKSKLVFIDQLKQFFQELDQAT
ncbi:MULTISPECIES: GNAT family N-acetyltransferase [Bacillus]|uniref:N-acetyltransferase domain-containing protein n=1 Tax=Bacillus pumilus TaxID=1408 RepID=A0A2G8ITC0_BACPU|nr:MULTISPECIES: GNAT family N-acetyltransferase [Bacillus]MCC9089326.1 GNAT family N-acetyltransferase [Bacillus pumilus]PIK26785.1 hypothetical protein CTV99_10585 [Bacillus pumilus]UUD43777.1 GNAT family N-acetyltransferase [Bacillus pumilus]